MGSRNLDIRMYVIIDASAVSSIDFSQVLEDSANTVRYSVDETKALVKFEGDTPSFLVGETEYNHSQIITILKDPSEIWCISDPQDYLDNLNS